MFLNNIKLKGITQPCAISDNIVSQQKNNLVYYPNIYFLNNSFFSAQKYSNAFDNVF